MKKMLVIAVVAALAAPAAVMADTTLYGKLHVSVGSVDDGTKSETVVESHSSRIGIKGSTELDNGMSATYGVEYGIDLDGDAEKANSTSRSLNARNTFVGVKGGFGEVRVGRHDTPGKLATAGLDGFADTYADMSNIIAADGHRVDNAVAYINKFGPVGFAVAHSTETDLIPASADGDRNGGSEANTAMINYGNGPWYAGLGYTEVDSTLKDTNLGLGWKAEAGHFANLVYEQVDYDGTPNDDTNAYVAGGFKTGAATLKVGYGESKTDNAGKEKQTTVGVDYSLGKKTSAYLLWNEDKNVAHSATTDIKSTQTVVGLVSEF
ncbi:porin [Candidatus Thiothrix sp. Deng01]|uniref:Porin n=1 Tax=Candidatus Thiothrix phosphatis TaxID=3112415 RepID=A0ABU6CWR3_9GAMM|nr:porin [Candidatus Thiothrix sp. Deng01]MEB4590987.1 porin [Candidatus Thiothrix sp. Deng01]